MNIILIEWIQLISTIWMTSIIWLIQLVHYPSFKFIEKKQFPNFATFHQKNISLIVMPMMILELISLIILFFDKQNTAYSIVLILLIMSWVSTFTLQVPCHQNLTIKKNDKIIKKLILTNWIRTLLWTFKLIIILSILIKTV